MDLVPYHGPAPAKAPAPPQRPHKQSLVTSFPVAATMEAVKVTGPFQEADAPPPATLRAFVIP